MSDWSNEDLCLIAVACACVVKQKEKLARKKKVNRRKWVKAWLLKRHQYSHVNLLEELRLQPDDWRNYLRMSEDCYMQLLELVTPLIKKEDTIMRSAITPHERLTATLRFLATGRHYADMQYSTIISPQSLSQLIPDTCSVIYEVLKNEYFKFVELKGSVFKKFDKNNLFQVSCSDVRERFHLVILLFIVVLQTMKEYSWKSDRFWVLLPDCVMVLIAEIFVDWVKHAFITRFNELQVDVYRDYTTSLAYDMAQTRQKHAFSDHSDLVARRMGFIPLPLGVVMIRVLAHSVHFGDIPSVVVSLVAYLGLSSYRVLNNILILGFACLLIAQHKQEKASAHSPSSHNRSGSPLTTSKSSLGKESQKDSATSPLKPIVDIPITSCPVVNINGVGALESISPIETDRINDLGSAVIFANSTVDLTYASLNEELLKVEGENIEIESEIEETFSRSEPNIKCDFQKENEELQIEDVLLKKRAESEPNLVNCKDDDDLSL